MRVLCNKIINDVTGEDDGLEDGWIKVGKEYTVLMMTYSSYNSARIALETDNQSTAMFHFTGFQFVSDYIPSSWITDVEEYDGIKYINMLPSSWNYESFFDDLDDEEEHAMELFRQEVEKIYQEEEEYEASKQSS